LGNKIAVSNGIGTTTFGYNELSQVTFETHNIVALNNSYTINYTYNLSGGVASVSDPQQAARKIEYSFDKVGRTAGASITLNGSTIASESNAKYRAWGGLKEYESQLNATGTSHMSYSYDAAQRVSGYQADQVSMYYYRYADGKVKKTTNGQSDLLSKQFDRIFRYHNVGRLWQGKSGKAANGDPGLGDYDTPYSQTIGYNSFSEETSVGGSHWNHSVHNYEPPINALTGRASTSTYDVAGNVRLERIYSNPTEVFRTYTWDAAGRQVETVDPPAPNSGSGTVYYYSAYDGDGRRVENRKVNGQDSFSTFELRSTVLGGEVIGTVVRDNNHPTVPQPHEFSAPGIDGTLKWKTGLPDEMAAFEWTAPEGLISKGEPLDPRGADVEWQDPYHGAESGAGSSYPEFPDASNPASCVNRDQPFSCTLEQKMNAEFERVKANWQKHKDLRDAGRQAALDDLHEARQTHSTDKLIASPGVATQVAPEGQPNATGDTQDPCAYGTDGGPNNCSVDVHIGGKTGPDPVGPDAMASNLDDFYEAVNAIRGILGENKGDNPCANFYGGAAPKILDGIVSKVESQGKSTFKFYDDPGLGISTSFFSTGNGFMGPSTLFNFDGSTTLVMSGTDPAGFNINTNGPFVSSFSKSVGSFGSANLKARVLLILHEIGHLTIAGLTPTTSVARYGGKAHVYEEETVTPLLPLDGKDNRKSRENTEKVEKACGGQIQKLK
jgi:hypothetical protein